MYKKTAKSRKLSVLLALILSTTLVSSFMNLGIKKVSAAVAETIPYESLVEVGYGTPEYAYNKTQKAISSTASGMSITDKEGEATIGSVRLKKAINLEALSGQKLAEILPYDCAKVYSEDGTSYVYNSLLYVNIKLIDVNDSSRFVYVNYANNGNYHCGYDSNNSLAQSWATEVRVLDERGWDLDGAGPDGTTRSGFYRQIETGTSDSAGSLNPYSMIYNWTGTATTDTVVRADGGVFTNTYSCFRGFSSNMAYIQVEWNANATGNGIIIKSLGGIDFSSAPVYHEEHGYEEVAEVGATCTSSGVASHYKCSYCGVLAVKEGEEFVNVVETDLFVFALGHTFGEWVEEIPATCTENGVKAHKDCTVCEKHFDVDGNEITDLTITASHTYGEWVEETPATCTENGVKAHKDCTVCEKHFDADGNEIADLTIASGHTYGEWVEKVEPTSESDGTEGHYHCESCGKNFDADGNEIENITIEKTTSDSGCMSSFGGSELLFVLALCCILNVVLIKRKMKE